MVELILGLVLLGLRRQNWFIKPLLLSLQSFSKKMFKYFPMGMSIFGNCKEDAGWPLYPSTIDTSKEKWSVAIFQFYWLGIILRAYEIPLELRLPNNSHFLVSHPRCYMWLQASQFWVILTQYHSPIPNWLQRVVWGMHSIGACSMQLSSTWAFKCGHRTKLGVEELPQ